MHAATGIDFDQDEGAKKRLIFPAKMKGGSIRRMEDLRYPTFWGALLDILPKENISTRRIMESLREGSAQNS